MKNFARAARASLELPQYEFRSDGPGTTVLSTLWLLIHLMGHALHKTRYLCTNDGHLLTQAPKKRLYIAKDFAIYALREELKITIGPSKSEDIFA